MLRAFEASAARDHDARLCERHALPAGRDRRELRERELLGRRIGLDLRHLRCRYALAERDRAGPDRNDRGQWNAQPCAHFPRVHRPRDLERPTLRGYFSHVGRVCAAEPRRQTRPEVATVLGGPQQHQIGRIGLHLLGERAYEGKR